MLARGLPIEQALTAAEVFETLGRPALSAAERQARFRARRKDDAIDLAKTASESVTPAVTSVTSVTSVTEIPPSRDQIHLQTDLEDFLRRPPAELLLDPEFRIARVGDVSVALPERGFALLDAILRCRPRPAYRDWLIESAWDTPISSRSFDRTLHDLRQRLAGVGFVIRNKWGTGAHWLERAADTPTKTGRAG